MLALLTVVALSVSANAFVIHADDEINREARLVTGDTNSRWHTITLPFTIDSAFSSDEKAAIMNTMATIQGNTCVKFVAKSNQRDYIKIVKGTAGCYSHVGRIGGASTMTLSPKCFKTKTGTVAHEFMHVMGFLHEHQRADRDSYIRVLYQNIPAYQFHQFDIRSNGVTFGLPYDYESVMQYGTIEFSSNGQPTMEGLNGAKLGPVNGEMSKGDFNKIKYAFKC